MQSYSLETSLAKRARILMQILILSGTLNIGLLATFAYFVLKEKESVLATSLPIPIAVADTNQELLHTYSSLSFQDLIAQCENKDLVEEGLTKRDLSLACLVAFHHFNLSAALGGQPVQRRTIPHNNCEAERIYIPVFPGLRDDQFDALLNYAKTEKWPLTAQGLFHEIKRSPYPLDLFLLDAFYLTPEYHAVQTIFAKTGISILPAQVISLIKQGEWEDVHHFTEKQSITFDLSVDRRRALLLSYLERRSKEAVKLFLDNDAEFILKRLNDAQILTVLDLYPEANARLENFAKALIASVRTDAVWKAAATILYTLANAPVPIPYDHAQVLARFLPQKPMPEASILAVAKPALPAVAAPAPRPVKKMHTIEPGDNLWKIARKYRVTVDALMRVNALETDRLKPGRQLEIPL